MPSEHLLTIYKQKLNINYFLVTEIPLHLSVRYARKGY